MSLKDWFNGIILVGFVVLVLYILASITVQMFLALGIWDIRALGVAIISIYSFLSLLKGIWELGTGK